MAQNKKRDIAAVVLSLLFTWRLPTALGLAQTNTAIAAHAVSIALAMGMFFVLRQAFTCTDKRLWRITGVVGLVFALFVVLGEPLRQTGELPTVTFGVFAMGLLDVVLYTVAGSCALLLLYQGVERLISRPAPESESLFSRLSGNGFIVFLLLLICWVPVWLAFYPGTFPADALNQFSEFINEDISPHHPILHTMMLGGLMNIALEFELEGYATAGVAIYCMVQMVLLAGMLAYACHWLRKRGAPLYARIIVTLLFMVFPFYTTWPFNAQKDILFGALCLLFVLQLVDVWREGFAGLRKPLRIISFVVIAALMMLMRNNGVYALVLALPLIIPLAKGARWRMSAIVLVSIGVYLLTNSILFNLYANREGDTIEEMLSIPLQQLGRAETEDPEAIPEDEREYFAELYPDGIGMLYYATLADPVKWSINSDALELGRLLSIWARVGVGHFQAYVEAFLVQNLPYFLPGSKMEYNLYLGIRQHEDELYWIQEHSYLPTLRNWILEYDKDLTFFGLPFVRLLSDTAFHMWLCIAALGFAVYRRQRQWIAAMGFLLGIWITCLLGPVAIMRYMLGVSYTMPVALAAMLAPQGERKVECADVAKESE